MWGLLPIHTLGKGGFLSLHWKVCIITKDTLNKADICCSGLLGDCAMCCGTFQCIQYYKLPITDFMKSSLTAGGSLIVKWNLRTQEQPRPQVRNFQFISNKLQCKSSTCRPWFLLMQIILFCGFPLRLCLFRPTNLNSWPYL